MVIHDTTGDIMDAAKIKKIRRRINDLRQKGNNVRHRDLEGIAVALGRKRSKTRTTEPTYVSEVFDTNVITIPDHSGTLKKWTAMSILDQLEADLSLFEEESERKENSTINATEGYSN